MGSGDPRRVGGDMTERKPPGVSWESWFEEQIRQAQEEGAFENLPGAGKPLPDLEESYDPNWWVKKLIRREKVSVLPPALELLRQVESEFEKIWKARDEAEVRARVHALTLSVQSLVFHSFADEKIFGWRPPKDRLPEIDTRRVRAMLARLAALDPRPLAEARPPERRLVGCCRDFTVLLCAMARHHGIPVRARVGFARYFIPDFHVDHEIVE